MGQAVQLAGSLLVLAAFVLSQRGILGPRSVRYLLLNLVGAAILAVQALLLRQWGFLLLEGVWAVVAAAGLAGVLRAARSREETG
ncbi:MAG: hypothetical protein GXX79_21740 [Actinomycetales bacterium]|nr:hypothetical protein [Actinomycetales bacterium]